MKIEQITQGMTGAQVAAVILENDKAAVSSPFAGGPNTGPLTRSFDNELYFLPDGVETSSAPPAAPWQQITKAGSPLDVEGGAASFGSVQKIIKNERAATAYGPEVFTDNLGNGFAASAWIDVNQGDVADTYTRSQYQRVEFRDSQGAVTEHGNNGVGPQTLVQYIFTAPEPGAIRVVSNTAYAQDYKFTIGKWGQPGAMYITPADIDNAEVNTGVLSAEKGLKLWLNDNGESGEDSEVTTPQSEFYEQGYAGHVTSPPIPVMPGDIAIFRVHLRYGDAIGDFFDASTGAKTTFGRIDGDISQLTDFRYEVTSPGTVQASTNTAYSDASITIFTPGNSGKIYLTPEDLDSIKASLFDVGAAFMMPKPTTLITVDFTTVMPMPTGKDSGWCNGKFKITVGSLSFEIFGRIEVQGSSSQFYPKKNWTMGFFIDEDLDEPFLLGIDNSIMIDEWVFKANWIDATMYRNIAANRLWKQFEQSRAGWPKRDIDSTYIGKTGAASYDTGATGVVDGYPAIFNFNGTYYGMGTFNMGKKRENYNLNRDSVAPVHYQIETGARQMDFYNMTLANGDYEYRSPRNSALGEPITQQFKTFAALPQAEFTAQVANVLEVRNWDDYVIFVQALYLPDNLGNNIMLTNWGGKFYLMPYDLDNAFGLHWAGTSIWGTNTNVFDGKSDLPANTVAFWKKYKVARAPQLAARYAELKSAGVLTVSNVARICKELETVWRQPQYVEEFARWPQLPSKDITNLAQITAHIAGRIAWMDGYFV